MGVGNRSEKRLETALLDTREGEQRHCVPEAGNRRPHTTAPVNKVITALHWQQWCTLGFSQQVSIELNRFRNLRGPTQAVTIANFSFHPVLLRALLFQTLAQVSVGSVGSVGICRGWNSHPARRISESPAISIGFEPREPILSPWTQNLSLGGALDAESEPRRSNGSNWSPRAPRRSN